MTMSITEVLSSFSGMAVLGEVQLRVGVQSPIFSCPILWSPRGMYEGGLPFLSYGKYSPRSPLLCIRGLSLSQQQQ